MQLVVVGGGTATNAIAPVFDQAAYKISYVVPVSDNGGSTSEVLRLFGGPAIGDARSRLVRLIAPSPLRSLLALRLKDNSEEAKHEWSLIVDGSHPVWTDIVPHTKAMYRSFLVHVHAELLKRTTTMRPFDFSRACVGNLLLTGARLFFGTLDAAIEFVLHTAHVSRRFAVLPCLESIFSHHIAARLGDGSVVVGQSSISHPAEELSTRGGHEEDEIGGAFLHPSLHRSQINFAKDTPDPLPSAIERLYYINLLGDEIRPSASPRVVTALQTSQAVVFSVGSLYTSIVPVLLLQGFAENMPSHCVLILNGSEDRETAGMTALDHLNAINSALNYSKCGVFSPECSYVSAVIHPSHTDVSQIASQNIKCVPAECKDGEYHLQSLTVALNACVENDGPVLVGIDEI